MTDRGNRRQEDLEQLSPEELEEEIKRNKKKAARSLVFMAAAAIAIIALCIAWFVSNTRVSGTIGTISAKYSRIEIGSKGSAGVHDDYLQKVKQAISYLLPESKKRDTSQGGSINWLLDETSNMYNYKEGKSFFRDCDW